ncbi:MAG: TonB-dependent receptor [Sphingomonadaceae bacterium]|nr:TonB-dependent receptor [Sphingomonadaceae bacterium]
MPLLPVTPAPDTVIVSAAREPEPALLSGVSASVIDLGQIQALQLPQATDYLRLTPSAAVAVSGGIGQQTQVRLRGAEANHTLVFVDGIQSNDPGSSSEFLFQTLPAEGLSRIEVLRGPQSALWGSEAIGGVVSVTTLAPGEGPRLSARAEGGSFGTYRFGAAGSVGDAHAGVSALAAYQATDGIDISGTPGGRRNGFDNLLLSAKAVAEPASWARVGAVVRWTDSTSRFDDFGSNGRPVDGTGATTNTAVSARGYAEATLLPGWTARADVTWFDAENRNRAGGVFQNLTIGQRVTAIGQTSYVFETGALKHRLTGAAEYRREFFRANATVGSGLAGSNQRRSRDQISGVGEYRVDWADRAAASISVRQDGNQDFADATTVRAAGALKFGAGFTGHASYGEGVANPTFIEQFGFFPGSFIGNPALKPERSRGYDVGLGWTAKRLSLDVTWYQTDLEREITTTFQFVNGQFLSSVANGVGTSRRSGLEVQASAKPADWLTVAATYAYTDSLSPALAGGVRPREVRRPEHSGSVSVIAERGRGQLAFTAAVVGDRLDSDFATFPARSVTMGQYALASVSARWRLAERADLTGRIENAFDARYQDVLGYRTPGLAAYGGVRVRL